MRSMGAARRQAAFWPEIVVLRTLSLAADSSIATTIDLSGPCSQARRSPHSRPPIARLAGPCQPAARQQPTETHACRLATGGTTGATALAWLLACRQCVVSTHTLVSQLPIACMWCTQHRCCGAHSPLPSPRARSHRPPPLSPSGRRRPRCLAVPGRGLRLQPPSTRHRSQWA